MIAPKINSGGSLVVAKNIKELVISSPSLKAVDLNNSSLNVVELRDLCTGKITFFNGKINRVLKSDPNTKIIKSADCSIQSIETINFPAYTVIW